MDFYKFLRNEEPDFKGRFLSDIWNFTNEEIEYNHDFIQLVFPLNKSSNAVFNNLYLKSALEIDMLKQDDLVQENLLRSRNWFINFLKNNNHWKSYSDHNQLRITRVIECLRLLANNKAADNFYNEILQLLGKNPEVNQTTLEFWKNA